MEEYKRVSIKTRIRSVALFLSVFSILITSFIAIYFMLCIHERSSETFNTILDQNVLDLIDEKIEIANIELEKYSNYLELDVTYVESLYEKENEYFKKDIPKRSPESDSVYLMQRSFENKSIDKSSVYDELTLLSNLEPIWASMLKKEGDLISTIYIGTETGLMISYDKYASMAEYDEDGEVYFNHKERTWYKKAKESGKVVFTDLTQDYFGRGLTFTCAVPFYTNGEFHGVVGMDILVSNLLNAIIDIDIIKGYDSDYAFLVNGNGDIVASPYIGLDTNEFENINDENNIYYGISNEILSGKNGMHLIEDFYCGYAMIEKANWILCLHIPSEYILQPIKRIDNYIRGTIRMFIIVFVVVFVLVIITVNSFSKEITAPIEKLRNEVEIISSGNFDRKINIDSNDEISDLAKSFNIMTESIRNYIDDVTNLTAEKERIGTELNVATNIQSSMLPSIFPAFPNDKRFDIYATMNPAKEVGGDFYDFFMIDNKHIAIVVADVSGKGVPAALFMVIGKTLIKDHTSLQNNLAQVFYEVNNILCESNSEGLFITAFEAIINLENGHVDYVNAGHEIPFIYRKGEGYLPHKMSPGFVLAGIENMEFYAGEFDLKPGDILFQYTDGVTEATNTNNELYGMDRLKDILNNNIDLHVNELLHAVKSDIDKFVGEAPQFDDITMLAFEFKNIDTL